MMRYGFKSGFFPFRPGILVFCGVLMLLFVALVVVSIILLVKWNKKRSMNMYMTNHNSSQFTQNEALNILNTRLAKGEITEEEYKTKKELILK